MRPGPATSSPPCCPIRERVLGPEHPDTLATRDNLARWTGEAGDAAGARDQFAALLPVRERVQGPEHPDTLTTRANLAYWSGKTQKRRLLTRADPATCRQDRPQTASGHEAKANGSLMRDHERSPAG